MPNRPTARPTEPLAVNEQTAAELLSLSPSSLEKDRALGHLGVQFVKAGRRILYRLCDLDLWLQQHTTTHSANDEQGGGK
jgi:hypothetical protein